MAAMKKKLTGKKKLWVNILAPQMFGEQIIGQSLVYEPVSLVGRVLSYNLMLLTNDIKKQAILVKFKINEIKGNDAHSVVIGYETSPVALKKAIRRNKNKIIQSFVMSSNDNINARIKTIFVTSNKTTTVKLKQLQYVLLNEIFEMVGSKSYNSIVSELLSDQIQGKIKAKLDKIYPLKFFQIYHIIADSNKHAKVLTKEDVSKIKVKVSKVIPKQQTSNFRRPFVKRPYYDKNAQTNN